MITSTVEAERNAAASKSWTFGWGAQAGRWRRVFLEVWLKGEWMADHGNMIQLMCRFIDDLAGVQRKS